MKKTLLTLLSFLLLTQLYAQKFEVLILANSGLFHYSGNGTASTSFINYTQGSSGSYPNYSFGNKNGLSYGVAAQGQYIAKCGFIAGLQAGYDVLRSKADITAVDGAEILPFLNTFSSSTLVKGSSVVQNEFINLTPFVGYRLPIQKINVDLLIGLDLPFGVGSYEKSSSTAADGTVYKTDVNYGKGGFDLRDRFGIAVSYHRYGITASYAHGLINHSADLLDDSPTVYEAHCLVLKKVVSVFLKIINI